MQLLHGVWIHLESREENCCSRRGQQSSAAIRGDQPSRSGRTRRHHDGLSEPIQVGLNRGHRRRPTRRLDRRKKQRGDDDDEPLETETIHTRHVLSIGVTAAHAAIP
jgi:hypothetical protein